MFPGPESKLPGFKKPQTRAEKNRPREPKNGWFFFGPPDDHEKHFPAFLGRFTNITNTHYYWRYYVASTPDFMGNYHLWTDPNHPEPYCERKDKMILWHWFPGPLVGAKTAGGKGDRPKTF